MLLLTKLLTNPSSGALLVLLFQVLVKAAAFSTGGSVFVYYDSAQESHRDLYYHPEQPERVFRCLEAITGQNSPSKQHIQLVDCAPARSKGTDHSKLAGLGDSRPITLDEMEHAREILLQVHQSDLVIKLEEKTRLAKAKRLEEGKVALGHMGYIDADTYLTTESFDICLRATAAWMRAVDDSNVSFALTRPPGHHATYTTSNGFCIFNFAAAAAAHAAGKGKRAAILDWDVHYGQGVADIVRRQEFASMIRYVSIHQTPAFPYQGEQRETVHNIRTIPIPPDTTWTCGYEEAFRDALEFCCGDQDPSLWKPDVIIVCAGYDALASDELAGTSLTQEDYYRMTKELCQRVKALDVVPTIMMGLEGGYQLQDSGASGNLAGALLRTLDALVEEGVAA